MDAKQRLSGSHLQNVLHKPSGNPYGNSRQKIGAQFCSNKRYCIPNFWLQPANVVGNFHGASCIAHVKQVVRQSFVGSFHRGFRMVANAIRKVFVSHPYREPKNGQISPRPGSHFISHAQNTVAFTMISFVWSSACW